MPDSGPSVSFSRSSYQTYFHRRWNHLNDQHVRSLAWLVDAPDLLDAAAPQWQGRVASLAPVDAAVEAWLRELDRAPEELHAYLGLQPFTRLGRYAERLMAFYFRQQGILVAHGLQVHGANNETIGEFDFLLRQGDVLAHWEFASKFYLLETSGTALPADRFVGPNLADTLGAKVRKIMERQLSLSQHPAAQKYLPQPVTRAQALVKGWLFYYGQTPQTTEIPGVSVPHCRGFWCQHSELGRIGAQSYMVLPRLSWLAPAKARVEQCLDEERIHDVLTRHFETETTPVMVALMERTEDGALETDRGFIVPDDWRDRAGERISRMIAAG